MLPPEIHRAQQTSKEHVQGGAMSSLKSGEEAAPAPTQHRHHQAAPGAQQTTHHVLL